MKINQLPNVLLLHLKRFKYIEHLGRWVPPQSGEGCGGKRDVEKA